LFKEGDNHLFKSFGKLWGKEIHFNLNAVELFISSWLMSASKSLKFNERANIESFALDINSF